MRDENGETVGKRAKKKGHERLLQELRRSGALEKVEFIG